MDDLQVKLNSIGEAIFQTYLFSPPLALPEPEPEPEFKPEPPPKPTPRQSQTQKLSKTAKVS
jgi:hypothetical protein